MLLLRWDSFGQVAKLVAGALDFAPQFLAPLVVHTGGRGG